MNILILFMYVNKFLDAFSHKVPVTVAGIYWPRFLPILYDFNDLVIVLSPNDPNNYTRCNTQ